MFATPYVDESTGLLFLTHRGIRHNPPFWPQILKLWHQTVTSNFFYCKRALNFPTFKKNSSQKKPAYWLFYRGFRVPSLCLQIFRDILHDENSTINGRFSILFHLDAMTVFDGKKRICSTKKFLWLKVGPTLCQRIACRNTYNTNEQIYWLRKVNWDMCLTTDLSTIILQLGVHSRICMKRTRKIFVQNFILLTICKERTTTFGLF